LAALVPIFIQVFDNGSEEGLKKLIESEIRRDGWDFFPTNKEEAKKLEDVSLGFFGLFK